MWLLVFSNLKRRLPRTVLTWLGLSIAFLLFGLLRAFVEYSLGERFVAASHERLVVSPRYSPLDALPLRYIGEIESMDGVVEVGPHQLLAGHIEGKRRFQQLVVDPQKHFSIFPEYRVDDSAKAAFREDRAAALAPVELAAEFGWTSGQRIAIESPQPGSARGLPLARKSRTHAATVADSGSSLSWAPTARRRTSPCGQCSCCAGTTSTTLGGSGPARPTG